MNWFEKIPHTKTAASGLEWILWRKLPLITLVGTLVPAVCVVLAHLLADSPDEATPARWLQTLDFMVIGAVVFFWSMVATVAIGCLIIMVMKGPGYVADRYPMPHSDQPRTTPQSKQEAARYRLL